MPKILINEKDYTSPGTPANYENYSVLIAGTWGDVVTGSGETKVVTRGTGAKSDAVKPDTNGVYEFTSADDFLDTIGAANPKIVLHDDTESTSDDITVYHYGNQMACELLKMGYTVIYKPFKIEEVNNLKDADFWTIFRDKSNYDFRFVSHGLLTSVVDNTETDDLNKRDRELTADITALESVLATAVETVNAGIESETEQIAGLTLESIYVNAGFPTSVAANEEALTLACKTEYEKLAEGKGIAKADKTYYDTFLNAVLGAMTERDEVRESLSLLGSQGVISTTLINLANEAIASLAAYDPDRAEDSVELPGRGDCVALIELDERQYTSSDAIGTAPEIRIASATKGIGVDKLTGKFCALTVPSVEYEMTPEDGYGANTKFPGAFHYLSCFKQSLNTGFKEWYAAAGYTRGVSKHTVKTTSVKLGEIAINALEPRYLLGGESRIEPTFACNVIAYFRGSYYLWGNRTAFPLVAKTSGGDLVASSFLNIRHLCTTIKKQLYVACRRFTFDPNSDTLWVNFVNAIKPTLEIMKADQGIKDYRVVKIVEANPKKATLKAKIRIIPIEAVEDFDLEISLEDSFGGTAVTATE